MDDFKALRDRLHSRLGIEDIDERTASQVQSEINRQVRSLELMIETAKPRLIMGGFRYGSNWKHKALMDYMQKKFDIFKETGNFEMLIDFVNFCAIESTLKTHPNFHFKPIDRS